jgi:hypothetical protein
LCFEIRDPLAAQPLVEAVTANTSPDGVQLGLVGVRQRFDRVDAMPREPRLHGFANAVEVAQLEAEEPLRQLVLLTYL